MVLQFPTVVARELPYLSVVAPESGLHRCSEMTELICPIFTFAQERPSLDYLLYIYRFARPTAKLGIPI